MEDQLYEDARRRMVEHQLLARDIHDPRVVEAMRSVPRHRFVPLEHRSLAYADGPLPIGEGQTISQPYIVALMTQLLELVGDEKVLEIGTGSGYQAAILAYLARQVYSIERHARLARRAESCLKEMGLENVWVHIGDGSKGLAEFSPYDAILVTAAAPEVPQVLLDQLTSDGRLVIPVGRIGGQILERWRRQGAKITSEALAPVAFVPLVGKFGWEG